MAIWLVRAGKRGQNQDFALNSNRVVIGWDETPDLSSLNTREAMESSCAKAYPEAKPKAIMNYVSQLWAFAKRINKGDLVALPLKGQDVIAFGQVTGDYEYFQDNPNGTKHTRSVKWISQDIPRERFDKDILYSLGAFMTVCRIRRNNAEERIKAILEGKSPPSEMSAITDQTGDDISDSVASPNLEEYSTTQILKYIGQKFAGHGLADITDAILQAQGHQTEVSPPGPDGGVDIIAGRGPMGFDSPRLCVQVKATSQQQDIRVLRELKGIMKDFSAEQGLFVSWSGFKRSVLSEARRQFFEIRLWDAGDVVKAVQRYYEHFPEDIKADLPLKRIWTLVQEEDSLP